MKKRSLLTGWIVLLFCIETSAQTDDWTQGLFLGKVIVTAQKQEQPLQEVPIDITRISSDIINKLAIVDAADLAQLAPSLNFESGGEARLFNFSIRGIGTRAFSSAVETSVSTVIDDVVYTRVGSAFDTLGDVDQVEILSGPQGTLFGKNSSAGVVNIRTKKPNTKQQENCFTVTFAQDNEHRTELILSGPITDTYAYRLYLYERSNDGNLKNLYDGSDENGLQASGIRAKLGWTPSESITILTTVDYSEKNANCCAQTPLDTGFRSNNDALFNPFTGDLDPVNGIAVNSSAWSGISEQTMISADVPNIAEQTTSGISIRADWEMGNDFTLTSVTAYREWNDYSSRDRDGSPAKLDGLSGEEIF